MNQKNKEECVTENYASGGEQRKHFFKAQSRKLLFSDWLTQVFAFLIVGSIYVGIVQFGASVSLLMESLTGNVYVPVLIYYIFLVVDFFLLFPLAAGIMYFEKSAIERGKGNIPDLFYFYQSSDELIRSCKVVLFALMKSFVFFLPSTLIDHYLKNIYDGSFFGYKNSVSGIDTVYLSLNVLMFVLAAAGFVLSSKNIMGMYVCIERENTSVRDCFFVAKLCVLGSQREMAKLVFSFVPLFALSLFTLGFLFVMYTIPYVAITLTMFSKYLYEKEMCQKNIKYVLYSQEKNENNPERK